MTDSLWRASVNMARKGPLPLPRADEAGESARRWDLYFASGDSGHICVFLNSPGRSRSAQPLHFKKALGLTYHLTSESWIRKISCVLIYSPSPWAAYTQSILYSKFQIQILYRCKPNLLFEWPYPRQVLKTSLQRYLSPQGKSLKVTKGYIP